MSAPTTPTPAGDQPTTPRQTPSRYALGSVPNMLRSLVVICLFMVALIFMVPRTNTISQPPVDVTGSAQAVASESGWPIEQPQGLPDGWKATSVRYEPSTGGLKTWHVGYQSPAGNYVAMEQTREATPEWIRAQTNRAPEKGTMAIDGQTWTKFIREDKTQNSLVLEGSGADLTTVITGTGTFEEMSTFIGRLEVVKPGAGAATSATPTATATGS